MINPDVIPTIPGLIVAAVLTYVVIRYRLWRP